MLHSPDKMRDFATWSVLDLHPQIGEKISCGGNQLLDYFFFQTCKCIFALF